MKKIALILIAILLTGCVMDTSATKEVNVDPSFQFNENEMYIEIRRKTTGEYFSSQLYRIYTSSEQAAYLLSGAAQFSTKLNDTAVQTISLSVGKIIETNNDTIYELDVDLKATSEQLEQIGPSITSLNISYENQPIINFNHSPIYISHDFYGFVLVGGYKEHAEDVSGLGLENNSLEDLSIKQLFVEGINNERYVIRDEPILFKQRDTIKLPINRQLLEQQHIEGVVGIYALLEDGREVLLTEAPFTIENYKEQMIEKLIQSIENK